MTRHRDDLGDAVPGILDSLQDALPEADTGELATRVAELRLTRVSAGQLRDYLQRCPDALFSGRSDGPAARLRLLDALAADHPRVQRARCVRCIQVKPLRHRLDDGRACATCYRRQHVEVCGHCGEVREVGFRQADGSSVCPRCRQRDPSTWRKCSICGKTARVAYRRDGQPLCQNCGPRRLHTCCACGRDRPVHAHTSDGPVCTSC